LQGQNTTCAIVPLVNSRTKVLVPREDAEEWAVIILVLSILCDLPSDSVDLGPLGVSGAGRSFSQFNRNAIKSIEMGGRAQLVALRTHSRGRPLSCYRIRLQAAFAGRVAPMRFALLLLATSAFASSFGTNASGSISYTFCSDPFNAASCQPAA